MYLGIREKDADIKAKLNDAIDAVKRDGTLNELIREWFGAEADTF